MKIISKIADLQLYITQIKSTHKTIGFVPTMGALHSGHISLVERSILENDVTIVSIFVNPTQFNDKNDLKNYPRTPEKDYKMLEEEGCNVVFAPEVSEMYPKEDTREFDFGSLATVMEGRFRPGHFNGVAQIVSKLFDIVTPDRAYFGEKDFQQLAIIRKLVQILNIPVKIIGCPIVREESGLAKSSRNELLSPDERKKASLISKTLFESRNFASEKTVTEVKDWVISRINAEPALQVEYFDIVDGSTLQSLNKWSESDYIVGCIAVFCGKVRLIDNVTY